MRPLQSVIPDRWSGAFNAAGRHSCLPLLEFSIFRADRNVRPPRVRVLSVKTSRQLHLRPRGAGVSKRPPHATCQK